MGVRSALWVQGEGPCLGLVLVVSNRRNLVTNRLDNPCCWRGENHLSTQQRPLIPPGFTDPPMDKSPSGPEGGMEMNSHMGSSLAQPLLPPPANYSLTKPEVKQFPGTTSSPNLITNLNDSQWFPLPDFYDLGDKRIYL